MRIQTWAGLLLLAGTGYLMMAGGCSEKAPTGEGDQAAPTVALVQPTESDFFANRLQDSTMVVVQAQDDQKVVEVQLWALFSSDSVAVKVGPALTVPDSTDYYSYFWRMHQIDNGTTGVLYAVATDESGNSTASQKVRVLIINSSQIGPPFGAFSITPSEGTVETNFTFDASPTVDRVNTDGELRVRWDFETDGIWDIDSSSDTTSAPDPSAATKVTHTYAIPDTYLVTLEVFNNYYPRASRVQRNLVVKPAEGQPRPEYETFVEIDPGIYPLGAIACTGCGTLDDDELVGASPQLYVKISTPYKISKYEVDNLSYVKFLNRAQASGMVSFSSSTLEVRSAETNQVYLVLDPQLTKVKYTFADSTFYVDQAQEKHPVTGVTWYGAMGYASFFGTRLPTEVEWEVAARGHTRATGQFYPWAQYDIIDGNYANFRLSGDPYEPGTSPKFDYSDSDSSTYGLDVLSTMGTANQAGNVAEWIKDWYLSSTYQDLYQEYLRQYTGNDSVPMSDPPGPPSGTKRGIRGGSCQDWPGDVRVTNRQAAYPYEKASWIGFRTAYTVF